MGLDGEWGASMRHIPSVGSIVLITAVLAACARPAAVSEWTPLRTPDGHPSFEGMWTTQTYTPLQRPPRYATQPFLTEAEAAALIEILGQEDVDPLATGVFGASDEERRQRALQNDPTHYNNATWLRTSKPKTLSSLRTSLIVDPPDGRLPALTDDGRRRLAARRAAAGFDSYENRPLQERCVVWTHEGPPMMPPPYNDVMQILQTPGYVTIIREVSTNLPRIIPTEAGHPPSDEMRQWAGVSRGRWEGDTLVVETTNFNDKVAFQGSSRFLRVVERFTRVSADRIDYRFTVDDPQTWTAPWTAEVPIVATDGRPYEYACHEGNYGLANTLTGARATDKRSP